MYKQSKAIKTNIKIYALQAKQHKMNIHCKQSKLMIKKRSFNRKRNTQAQQESHNIYNTTKICRWNTCIPGWSRCGYSLKFSTFLISFGRLFHTRADSKRREFFPYLVVLTVGISAIFSYPKLWLEDLQLTRSLMYSGDRLVCQ